MIDRSNKRFPISERSVLVSIKATPEGLRRMADTLERCQPGERVRVNWYTVQIEFVRDDEDNSDTVHKSPL